MIYFVTFPSLPEEQAVCKYLAKMIGRQPSSETSAGHVFPLARPLYAPTEPRMLALRVPSSPLTSNTVTELAADSTSSVMHSHGRPICVA